MNKFKHSPATTNDISTLTITKRCFAFSLIFSFIATFLLLISTAIFISLDDPTHWSNILGKIILYLSAFISSFLLSKKNGQGYIFSGIVLGAIITGIIFVLSLIFPNSTSNSIMWILLIPATTLLGSVLGIKRQGKPKRHKRHR